MNNPQEYCRNTTGPIGCPDGNARLICFRPRWHEPPCFDAVEHIWWRSQHASEHEPTLAEGSRRPVSAQ